MVSAIRCRNRDAKIGQRISDEFRLDRLKRLALDSTAGSRGTLPGFGAKIAFGRLVTGGTCSEGRYVSYLCVDRSRIAPPCICGRVIRRLVSKAHPDPLVLSLAILMGQVAENLIVGRSGIVAPDTSRP